MRRSVLLSLTFLLALTAGVAVVSRADDSSVEAAVADGEAASIPTQRAVRDGAEKFEFQAEVSRLMDIIINSLYSNKDIFLRELISNASDALDKIRFLSLTDPAVLGEGSAADLDIRIKLDPENNILSIRDRGIGMTRQQLKDNLGTIAKSGTSAFLEQMQKSGDMNLIGQFGVGFYSVYLVADYVEVVSKNNEDGTQNVWESGADGNFAISEDTEGESLDRGTEIRIHLKEEAAEYTEEAKLKELVGKYSEFINFPIYLWSTKTVEREMPVDEEDLLEEEDDEEAGEDDDEDDDEDDVEDEDYEEEDVPLTKTVKEEVSEWELLNDNKAIWLRSSSEVDEEEYEKFYKAISKDYQGPLAHTHFKAEGDVEFKAVLFIPKVPPPDLYDNYYNKNAALSLYVRRVFISNEFDELLPKYLSFIKGLVDSDTLPLNVSRETLQQHSSLKTIKKKLIRKVLDMIRKLSDGESDEESEEADDKAASEVEEAGEEAANKKYDEFWEQYGKALKLGIIEDASNRNRLAKLLRFQTSKSDGKLVSLQEYVDRMKEGQKHIYYLAGQSVDEVKGSPFLEKLLKKDLEVIFFSDPVDEYMMQSLTEFEDYKFQNASKEDLKFGDKDDKEREAFKELKADFKELTEWWKGVLPASEVEAVKVSNRLSTTPCIVVTSKYGWSANMERIMAAQAMASDGNAYMRGRKTLEINAYHPVIASLKERVAEDGEDEEAALAAKVMYETALLESGFALSEAKEYSVNVLSLIKQALGVDPNLEVVEPEEVEEEEEEEEEAAEEDEEDEDEEAVHDEL